MELACSTLKLPFSLSAAEIYDLIAINPLKMLRLSWSWNQTFNTNVQCLLMTDYYILHACRTACSNRMKGGQHILNLFLFVHS